MYYKATRPNGTDFRTGSIDYAAALGTGKPVTWEWKRLADPKPARMVKDNPATYISLSSEPGEVLTGGSWPCRLFHAEPVGQVIGHSRWPWKACCRKVLIVEELPAHLALGPQGEQVAAIIERAARFTGEEILALNAARDAAWAAAWDAAGDAAGAAAWDPAGAAVVKDLITDEQFQLLNGPWLSVIGEG